MMRHVSLLSLTLLMLAQPALAQQQRYVQYASGTGFYINRNGDLITNEHVVRGCQSIVVRTPQGDKPATLAAVDSKRDLAVLRTQSVPTAIAPLRWNIADLKQGDTLYVYGFPGKTGADGQSTFVRTTLSAIKGPTGQPEWLQLQTPSQKGNSGGPVLDATGNVIAVIFGRAEIYETATTGSTTPKLVGSTGIAITLSELREFLKKHMTGFYESASGLIAHAEPVIAQNAAKFTFPVLCMQGVVTR